MNMPITKTADEERIAELEAKLSARDEALKVAREVLEGFGCAMSIVISKIEELTK